MNIPLNDLSRRSAIEIESDLKFVSEVLESAHYLKGRFTELLESTLSARISKDFVLSIANGTDALRLAFQGLGLTEGELVAAVPNAGGYATTAAKQLGLEVGLVDIELESHQMSPEALLKFLSKFPETRAVVVTHLYGQIGFIKEINQICIDREIWVIEDCAQSFGAKSLGIEAGGFGDVATFSFYPTKNLGAAGDAGAVAFKNKEHFAQANRASQYGWSDRYTISQIGGSNSRMDEIQAAILVNREKKVDVENIRRREIAAKFKASLPESHRLIGKTDESFVAHLAVVDSPKRDDDMKTLKDLGIDVGVHYPVLDSEQPAWNGTLKNSELLPNSELAVKRIFTIPCFPRLTDTEVELIANALSRL